MAFISDVRDLFVEMATGICYPGGVSAPSITGGSGDIKVYPGWPQSGLIDQDLAAGITNVSVFPTRASGTLPQYLPRYLVQSAPIHGMTASVEDITPPPLYGSGLGVNFALGVSALGPGGGGTIVQPITRISVSGTPGPGEYLTVIVDGGKAYSESGPTLGAILQALASDIAADYPGTQVTSQTISIPGLAASRVTARVGAPGQIVSVTHRKRDLFMVSVWAPTPALRDLVAAPLETAFAATNRLTFPDQSQGIMVMVSSAPDDTRALASEFRHTLTISVDYAAISITPAYEVTSFGVSIENADGSLQLLVEE